MENPEVEGLRAALRIKEIQLAEANVEAAKHLLSYATQRLNIAQMESVFAHWSSETGQHTPGMNAPSLKRWLDKEKPRDPTD